MAFENARPTPIYCGTYTPKTPSDTFREVVVGGSVIGYYKESYDQGEGEELRTNHVLIGENDEHFVVNGSTYLNLDMKSFGVVGALTKLTYEGKKKGKKGPAAHRWNIQLDRTNTKEFSTVEVSESPVTTEALSNSKAPAITASDVPF